MADGAELNLKAEDEERGGVEAAGEDGGNVATEGGRRKMLAARIRRVMRLDEDMGRLDKVVPAVLETALRLHIQDMVAQASEIAVSRGGKTLSAGHLKVLVNEVAAFDYLRHLFVDVPDLEKKEDKEDEKKRKRKERMQKKSVEGGPSKSRSGRKKTKPKRFDSDVSEYSDEDGEYEDEPEEDLTKKERKSEAGTTTKVEVKEESPEVRVGGFNHHLKPKEEKAKPSETRGPVSIIKFKMTPPPPPKPPSPIPQKKEESDDEEDWD